MKDKDEYIKKLEAELQERWEQYAMLEDFAWQVMLDAGIPANRTVH